mgnify:CR=1 FL=1
MTKLKLTGLGEKDNKSYFIFEKDENILNNIQILLDNLGFDKLGLIYENEESNMSIEGLTDIYDTISNQDYELDFLFGKDKLVLIARSDNNDKLKKEILELSEINF